MINSDNLTTKRVTNKVYVCLACKKATYKRITGGAISFFDNCTLTENCSGRLVRDHNQQPSKRSELTWREKSRVYKHEFTNKQIVEIPHRFGHLGAVMIEPFVLINSTGGIQSIKQMVHTVVGQTANSVTIDLGFTRSGTIVVTDNQYHLPNRASVVEYPASPLLLLDHSLTIAVDQETALLSVPVQVKTLSAQSYTTVYIDFLNHISNPFGINSTSLWNRYKFIAADKPYYLYSAIIPQNLLARGNTLTLQLSGDWIIPLTAPPSVDASDIVMNQYWRGTNSQPGDLVSEANQLIISNPSGITVLPKQFVVV
jgi:hypothetical protein